MQVVWSDKCGQETRQDPEERWKIVCKIALSIGWRVYWTLLFTFHRREERTEKNLGCGITCQPAASHHHRRRLAVSSGPTPASSRLTNEQTAIFINFAFLTQKWLTVLGSFFSSLSPNSSKVGGGGTNPKPVPYPASGNFCERSSKGHFFWSWELPVSRSSSWQQFAKRTSSVGLVRSLVLRALLIDGRNANGFCDCYLCSWLTFTPRWPTQAVQAESRFRWFQLRGSSAT